MNKKPIYAALALVLLVCLTLPTELTKADVENPSTGSLLLNPGFESGDHLPAKWLPDSWIAGAEFVWDNAQSAQGARSVRITMDEPNDARWLQSVTVRPYTDYRLSGWIKTEDVDPSSGLLHIGANLSVYGTWDHTAALIGTNDWTNVTMTFNTGSRSEVLIAARLGYWSGTVTGTAWFDDLILEPVEPSPLLTHNSFLPIVGRLSCASPSPSWNILVLAYESTDFIFTDGEGHLHQFVSTMAQYEKDKLAYAVNRFVKEDIPVLNSCAMHPTVTIRYPDHPLRQLTPLGCSDYAPSPLDTLIDRDPAFDSVITIWDGSGTDLLTGQSMSIQGCAWAWGMGTGQTYDAIYIDFVQYIDRNVFKHEWGHSILFYYEAAGTAPLPPVDNHEADEHVNCLTGQPYILQDETDLNPIPNSIYHNESGFTHDYYSGLTATADQPTRCLGIPPAAWASGGPVTRPLSGLSDTQPRWRSPADDVITTAVPYH